MTEKSEQYWKILNGECGMREALAILDFKPDYIDLVMKNISLSDFMTLGVMSSMSAYMRLNEAGEMDIEKVFNIGTNKYSEGDDRRMDYGIKNNVMHYYNGKNWEIYN
jgi:hypothetical protein